MMEKLQQMPGQLPTLWEGWMPPTREHYDLILTAFQWGYLVTGSIQWVIGWYGMGKTSTPSLLNIPGRWAWLTMESPGFLTLGYLMGKMSHGDLPWQNKVLAALFVMHYAYRAVAFPFLQPSMAPVHVFVWLAALGFQVLNATCLGSWLAAYGPVHDADWDDVPLSTPRFVVGVAVFYLGLASNYFHDEELREIRRRERRRQDDVAARSGTAPALVRGHYRIPEAGLFRYVLFAHYLCEWVEWSGFWLAAGWSCAPARAFLVNEIAAMLPRAVRGKAWYREHFGEDKIRKKYAVIPGVI
ncbi:3-oxo-5-alpha-steroid 4-dehydrogenase 1 [Geosmithia morbida]|uniref:3-oxo-5-alpha-steroid 4-dehydrogenase 1 n=1 Tax=Geosmithia morbida TaxID=1094350 RepID=A0A9P4YM69_9HYPO|nr:3-oxo-5-alpha-steroid 4-dehydrogenase 1 [Geosmithia morbida]KAF4119543.1 3-oxo-5-alpha-steroid 4-dehydrogenase 1 [Geosmithia morbida]